GPGNTYAGDTTVKEGSLDLNGLTADKTVPGKLTIGDGVGDPSSAVAHELAFNQIANTDLVINKDGLLALGPAVDVLGPITLSGGAITATSDGGNALLGDVTATGDEVASISGNVTLNGSTRAFHVAGPGALVVTAAIHGDTEGLTKNGPGALILAAITNDYGGPPTRHSGHPRESRTPKKQPTTPHTRPPAWPPTAAGRTPAGGGGHRRAAA